jgi:hypothetical protein
MQQPWRRRHLRCHQRILKQRVTLRAARSSVASTRSPASPLPLGFCYNTSYLLYRMLHPSRPWIMISWHLTCAMRQA